MEIVEKIRLEDIQASNLFLRKLWSEFRKDPSFDSMEFGSKIGSKKIVSLAIISLGNSDSCGIDISYSKKGVINGITIHNVSEDDEDLFRGKLAVTKSEYQSSWKEYWISFPVSYQGYPLKNYSFSGCNIVNTGNENSIELKNSGFDFLDAATFSKPKVDFFLSIISLYTLSCFSVKAGIKDVSGNYGGKIKSNQFLDASFDSKTRSYGFFDEKYHLSSDLFELLKWIAQGENWKTKLSQSTRLFVDALAVESSLHEVNRVLREVSHTLYISSLEIVASLYREEVKSCESCSQPVYSISKGIYDLIKSKTPSENIAKWIKKEYQRRSKFVHEGTMYSSNNYLGFHIPQLSPSDPTGNVLQHSLNDLTHGLRITIRQLILDELMKLMST